MEKIFKWRKFFNSFGEGIEELGKGVWSLRQALVSSLVVAGVSHYQTEKLWGGLLASLKKRSSNEGVRLVLSLLKENEEGVFGGPSLEVKEDAFKYETSGGLIFGCKFYPKGEVSFWVKHPHGESLREDSSLKLSLEEAGWDPLTPESVMPID